MPAPTPPDLLDAALARDPARPLLTFHDDDTGERTELSVATFANWVAKTANLLRDDLALEPGARVRVDLPVHWQAAVWLQACWALGLTAALGDQGPVDVAVITHDVSDAAAGEVVSLGLGPMGLPRPGAAPAYPGALDYDREVHGHADRFVPTAAPTVDDIALVTTAGAVTAGELAAAATSGPRPTGAVLVTEPVRTLGAVLASTLVPLATDVTAVLVRHLDHSRLEARIEQEQIAVVLGEPVGGLAAWRPVNGG